ncbi:c-type cytochrome [Rubrivivax gelatinosus]|uniref:Cytochrome C n=1 Tax=Rubrivivax gelatinosus TaxID=28068 RepID=A0ABS1DXR8_RUBGE|nr:c-type cytochrome [Rubrivivax gelatinosus]MBK1713926.1 cytochrome C [Rubrivivax gelatinosus]
MSKLRRLWLVWPALAWAAAAAAPPPAADGAWNAPYAEKQAALAAPADAARGEIAFEVCQGCHRSGALGRTDGSYPRLAGQHASVLIKQMTDIRAGLRRNEKMRPFIDDSVAGTQDLADIAAYLAGLPSPPNNGQGPGTDLARGEALYRAECSDCHGRRGEGDPGKFYPRLNGQHYRYMLREVADIRDGRRGNANPHMVTVVKKLPDAELAAIVDYLSRLPTGPR